MPYTFIQGIIDENQCIGDSLDRINNNYTNLDTGLATASAQNITLINKYNTLVRSLTSVGAVGTDYTSLSAIFQSLQTLIVP